ncbi:MAG: PLP-dependent cysteine synthase family protein [Candidatus Aquicultorales bacterium]
MLYKHIADMVGETPLLELDGLVENPRVRLLAKLEGQNPSGSVKDRIVRRMLLGAEATGRLKPGMTLIEPTSGNTGIALAMMAKIKGYKFIAVMPENVSHERRELIEAYGAELVLTAGEKGTNGAIAVAKEIAAERPEYFMLDQYANEDNPRAHYEGTGPEILRDAGKVDVFVAGLGTGGTLMGVGRRVKEANRDARIIAVQPYPHGGLQGLRNVTEGYIPPILDLSALDASVLVRDEDAFRTTRLLMQEKGLFMGISSGAVVWEAVNRAGELTEGTVVALLADGGWKYLSERIWLDEPEEVSKKFTGPLW